MANQLVIGLTGSFGSGCTTVAKVLREKLHFASFALSDPIKEWTNWSTEALKREDLQNLGNKLRQTRGLPYLAEITADKIAGSVAERVAVDGIRNLAEIEYFRATYPDFFLLAVLCPQEERWRRLADFYRKRRLDQQDFLKDDTRDHVQEIEYGQQVALCVDDADLVLSNEEHQETQIAAEAALVDGLGTFVDLVTRSGAIAPTTDEIAMTIAYAQSRRSFCLKRQVGAVIADSEGNVISTGFNENPTSMEPCYVEFGYCYKESMMSRTLKGTKCPGCDTNLPELSEPFKCPDCGFNLKLEFFQDRGMRWCTALHAEERALINARGRDLRGSTVYSTTFPCFNCSRQLAQAGIRKVVYVEPYPQLDVPSYLRRNKVEVVPFQGVKARSSERLFSEVREKMEKRYQLGGAT